MQGHPVLDVVTMEGTGGARPVPLARRPRVLDLTRVLAGPVASRTLALLGCDVLRVDPPGLPEIEAQHVDTGAGKRSTLLDLCDAHSREVFRGLLAGPTSSSPAAGPARSPPSACPTSGSRRPTRVSCTPP